MGYPLQGINSINEITKKLVKSYGPILLKELEYAYSSQFERTSDFALRFMSSDLIFDKDKFLIHLQPKYYQKFLSAESNINHGVLSALFLMKDLVFFKESDFLFDELKPFEEEDARQFLIRKEIIRSIASHSCEDIYHLTIPNFSFIITVIDEMQEWGRPRLIDVTKRMGTDSALTVNVFNSELIHYSIIFKFDRRKIKLPEKYQKNMNEQISSYFLIKYKKWCNVLRSAVGGKNRKLRLKFTIIDNTYNKIIYEFEHINPKKINLNENAEKIVNKD